MTLHRSGEQFLRLVDDTMHDPVALLEKVGCVSFTPYSACGILGSIPSSVAKYPGSYIKVALFSAATVHGAAREGRIQVVPHNPEFIAQVQHTAAAVFHTYVGRAPDRGFDAIVEMPESFDLEGALSRLSDMTTRLPGVILLQFKTAKVATAGDAVRSIRAQDPTVQVFDQTYINANTEIVYAIQGNFEKLNALRSGPTIRIVGSGTPAFNETVKAARWRHLGFLKGCFIDPQP